MRKIFCIIATIMLVFLIGCAQETVDFSNNNLNAENNSFFIKADNKVYLSKDVGENEFSIVKKKGKSEKEVVKTKSFVNSYSYYNGKLVYLDDSKICLYDLNSDKLTVLTEVNCVGKIIVENNFIYYVDNAELIKLDIETGVKKYIANDVCMSFDILGEIVYYQSINDDGKGIIKRANSVDAVYNDIVCEGAATYITAQDDGVYFLNYNGILPVSRGDHKIYKTQSDGTVDVISEHKVSTYNICDEMIYYANREDNGHLYRMKLDGSDSEKIFNKEVISILVYGQEVFCQTRDNEYKDVYCIDSETLKATKVTM